MFENQLYETLSSTRLVMLPELEIHLQDSVNLPYVAPSLVDAALWLDES